MDKNMFTSLVMTVLFIVSLRLNFIFRKEITEENQKPILDCAYSLGVFTGVVIVFLYYNT